MKYIWSWIGFKSKKMCLHELWDNGYESNKQCYQMRANISLKRLNSSYKHLHFIFILDCDKGKVKIKIKRKYFL